MAEVTPEEWRSFLREPARPTMVATVRPDGRPHVAAPAGVVARKHIPD